MEQVLFEVRLQKVTLNKTGGKGHVRYVREI